MLIGFSAAWTSVPRLRRHCNKTELLVEWSLNAGLTRKKERKITAYFIWNEKGNTKLDHLVF